MSTTSAQRPAASGGHPCWEQEVYAKGRQLNRYPYHAVVGFVLSHYGQVPDRAEVHIAELGFGAGNNLWFAAREGFSVAGVEGSPTAVRVAKDRFAADGLTGDLRVGDFAALPWDDGSVDVVIDRGALTCARKQTIQEALDEARRVLCVGGRLLSVIYSDAHPGRSHGVACGDNDYEGFTGGYFAGLGTAHFVPRSEIDDLFGRRFTVTSLVHTREECMFDSPDTINAFWKVECVKDR